MSPTPRKPRSTKATPGIADIKRRVLALGMAVEDAIGDATRALRSRDTDLARTTIDRERATATLEMQCDELLRSMMPLERPGDGDQRALLASIRTAADLEHMGDLAAGICHGVLTLDDTPVEVEPILDGMDALVREQVAGALKALAGGDVDLARDSISRARAVDARYRTVFRRVLDHMVDNPHHISGYMVLLDIAKTLEWIGDHATNIGETVIYAVRGHDDPHVDRAAAAALLEAQAGA